MPRLAVLLASAVIGAEPVPQARVETLDGRKLELSRDVAPGSAVLIIGFTKASRVQATEWSKRLESDLAGPSKAPVYEVAVLADVPRLFRGFVISQIRASVPKFMHPRFLLVLEHAEVWKRLADVRDVDAAYVVLIDRGQILWRSGGRLSEAGYPSLLQSLESAAREPAPVGPGRTLTPTPVPRLP